jgi:hypothetical protein
MQAFWVRTAGSTGGLQLNNDARMHSTQSFYKKAPETTIFRMYVSRDSLKDELVVGFYASATDAFDPYDSEKMFSTENDYPQTYTLIQDTIVTTINGEPELLVNEVRTVPVGFKTNVAGIFMYTATNLSDFDPAVSVFLEDAQTGTFQDLRQNNSYSFTSGITNDAGRFKLHFSSLTTRIETLEGSQAFVYTFEKNVYINNPQGAGTSEVYDMLGKKIGSQSLYQGVNKLNVNLNQGIYIVKTVIISKVALQKIVIN